ncbi:MAG: hypothetical protein IT324_00385 [Anaerolineae bacterium]|nr:hypothetical protein [Anaerolineae bacterium]
MATMGELQQPKKSNTTRNILIVVAVLVIGCVVCVGAVFALTGGAILTVFNAVKPITDASEGFMNALKTGDYNTAYNLLTPDVQTEVGGNANGLKSLIESNNSQPVSWSFSNVSVNNDRADFSGSVTFTGNRSGTGSLVLMKSGDAWKVAGFDLKPTG